MLCLYVHDQRKKGLGLRLDIGNNPINCDCKDYKFIALNRLFVHDSVLNNLYCFKPAFDIYQKRVGLFAYFL